MRVVSTINSQVSMQLDTKQGHNKMRSLSKRSQIFLWGYLFPTLTRGRRASVRDELCNALQTSMHIIDFCLARVVPCAQDLFETRREILK